MKKLVFLLLCLTLAFSLVACDKLSQGSNNTNANEDDFDLNTITVNSAYAKAQKLGYEGSLENFVELISGKDGVGIDDVIINNDGNLIITLSTGEEIDCGKVAGKDGKDGVTPTIEISSDGYWVINGFRTGYKAIGTDGTNGTNGIDGVTPTIEISSDGYWVINGVKTGYKAIGGTGGEDGKTPIFKLENGDLLVSYDDGTNWDSLGNIQGAPGYDETTPIIGISKDGYWIINGVETTYKATDDATPICQHRDADDNYYCDKCEKPYVDGMDIPLVPEHTHRFGEWKIYQNDTYYCENALYFRVCSGCNVIEWKDGSEADHSYVTVVTPPTCHSTGYTTKTCSKCGKSEVYNETAVVSHTYSTYSSDNSYHWKKCQYCDMRIEYAEHDLGDDGICNICNNVIGDTAGVIYDISADGTYAEVVGYLGTAKKVRIASEYKGLPVTNIYKNSFYNNDNITMLIIPDSVTTIGSSAFYDCDYLTSITMGSSVTTIGFDAFYSYNIRSVYISDIAAWCNISFASYSANPLDNDYGGTSYLYLNGKLITDLVIPDGVTTINSYAFSNCRNITGVTIPDSVTSIGYAAFYNCDGLTSVTIGNGVTSIGDYAFSYCSGLTSVTIGNGVTSIGDSAFYSCNSNLYTEYEYGRYVGDANDPYQVLVSLVSKNLRTYIIHENTKHIAPYVFENCERLETITIPNGVTGIGYSAFSSCSALKDVYITDIAAWCNISFGNYYANPLYYATNLYLNGELITELVIPDGVTAIPMYAFYRQSSITNVTIGNGVTRIGDGAFSNCSGLTSVVIPDGVTSIGSNAFRNCSALTSVVIPDSVISIGDGAFYDCSSLTSVVIPDSITSIGSYAFRNCSALTSVIIGNGVTSIGNYAFYYCDELTSVIIGNGVTSIGDSAFHGCSKLKNVYYTGSEAEWKSISIGYYNSPLTSATRYYNYVPEEE